MGVGDDRAGVAMGWMSTWARRTVLPLVASSAMRPMNSKNFQHRRVFEGGRVRHVSDHRGAFQGGGESLAGQRVTPEAGDAASVSGPRSRSLVTSFDPMSPVPPMTTIFMMSPRPGA